MKHGSEPVVSYLKVFSCLAWNHIPKDNRKKLDAKSEQVIVIGCYENSQYKIWIPSRNVATVSRDVSISENIFPGAKKLDWNGVLLLAPMVKEESDHPFSENKSIDRASVSNKRPDRSDVQHLHEVIDQEATGQNETRIL